MLVPKVIAANIVEGKAKRRDLGTDDGVLVGRHHACGRNATDCQKQYGKQRYYDMSRAGTHRCQIHDRRMSCHHVKNLMMWYATNNLAFIPKYPDRFASSSKPSPPAISSRENRGLTLKKVCQSYGLGSNREKADNGGIATENSGRMAPAVASAANDRFARPTDLVPSDHAARCHQCPVWVNCGAARPNLMNVRNGPEAAARPVEVPHLHSKPLTDSRRSRGEVTSPLYRQPLLRGGLQRALVQANSCLPEPLHRQRSADASALSGQPP
ncbi:hypothetical protein ATI53_10541 [Salipiger aestuarii]|uniref:Uncharacterized protein n=1 Tax=Salipiger aestuarii TaxID=568098 RepID=A0A327XR44_9RHOB|nr:hypothetical protein ATI53_10541 [Salipiger aestuarii]